MTQTAENYSQILQRVEMDPDRESSGWSFLVEVRCLDQGVSLDKLGAGYTDTFNGSCRT